MHDVQGDLILRPALRTGLTVLATVAAGTAVMVAAILAGEAPSVIALLVGAPLAALVGVGAAALLRARIVLTPHELVEHGLFGRKRRPRSQIAAVVRATVIVPKGGPGENVFVLGPDRDVLFRVSAGTYPREDLDRLVQALGVPCDHIPAPVRASELEETYPGLVSRAERNPYGLAFALLLVVAAVVVACVVACAVIL